MSSFTTSHTIELSEPALWRQFKRGDRHAFSAIYHQYYPHLYSYGLKITADEQITEDCIQDLFTTLWQARERVSDVQSIKAYLFKALRGRLFKQIKQLKKKSLLKKYFQSGESLIVFSTEELLIQGQVSEEQQQRLVQALNKLTGRQKEVIYLRFYKHLSYEEIGEILPLSYQSIRNCVHEALKVLKKHMVLACILLAHMAFSA